MEERALFLLTAAGLVDRRATIRLTMAGQEGEFEATFVATGEAGLARALQPFLEELRARWAAAFVLWTRTHGPHSVPFHSSAVGEPEWRLTDQGVLACGELNVASGDPSRSIPVDFVMRAGRYRGRPAVGGEGRLIAKKLPAKPPEPPAVPVSVVNLQQLGEALGQALGPLLQRTSADPPKSDPPRAGETPAPSPAEPECVHGEDFTWVVWFGRRYVFKKGYEAQTVKALWKEWERSSRRDGCGLGDEAIAQQLLIDIEMRFSVKDLFRNHEAMGPMIREVMRGVHALYRPDSAEDPNQTDTAQKTPKE
jgi:hypothetical protein